MAVLQSRTVVQPPEKTAAEMAASQKPVKGTLADFLNKSPAVAEGEAKKTGLPQGMKPPGSQAPDPDPDADPNDPPTEHQDDTPPGEPKPKRTMGFIKKTKLEAGEYKEKFEKTEAELKKVKDEELPALQKERDEWKAKAEGAGSAAEYKTAMEKYEAAQKELDSVKKTTEEQAAALRFYNLQHDPEFQRGFVVPVTQARTAIDKFVGENDAARQALSRAISAHASAMQSTKPEDRAEHESTRDAILEEVYSMLPEMRRGRFGQAVADYINKTESLSHALINHEETNRQITAHREKTGKEQREKVKQTWRGALEKGAELVKPWEALPDEMVTIAKELKVDYDITADTELANNVIDPDIEVPAEEATRLLQQGRVYKPLVSRIKVLEKQLADRDAIIAKYRGGKPGGESSSRQRRDAPTTLEEGRANFIKKFTPQQ